MNAKTEVEVSLPIDNWLASVTDLWCFRDPIDCNGNVSLINSSSRLLAVFLAFDVLLLEAVLLLVDDLLVPEENDEPSEMIELGRCEDLDISGKPPENEFLNLGATKKNKGVNYVHKIANILTSS